MKRPVVRQRLRGYTGASETVVIPQSLGGYPVTRIEEGAFSGSGMKKVVIAQTVSTVAGGAFARCENLETVVLFDASFEASYEWAGLVIRNFRRKLYRL